MRKPRKSETHILDVGLECGYYIRPADSIPPKQWEGGWKTLTEAREFAAAECGPEYSIWFVTFTGNAHRLSVR